MLVELGAVASAPGAKIIKILPGGGVKELPCPREEDWPSDLLGLSDAGKH